jgi:hypothetical protein
MVLLIFCLIEVLTVLKHQTKANKNSFKKKEKEISFTNLIILISTQLLVDVVISRKKIGAKAR